MARQCPMVKRGKDALKSTMPSLALVTSSACTRRLTHSLTPGRRSNPSGKSGANPAPRRTHPPRTQVSKQPTDKALCNKAQQRAWQLDTNFDAWPHKKIAKGIAGWATGDTMICDLPKHERCNQIIQTQWGHPWTTWVSTRSSTVSSLTSTTCAGSTSWGQ